jgi:hypothetical protein
MRHSADQHKGWNKNAFFKVRENAKIMRKWDDFREIAKISRKFRENEKSIKFYNDTACMVHVV